MYEILKTNFDSSRHYCDYYELIRKGVGKSAEGLPELLARVAQHKCLVWTL